eukprot:TRINITY_DN21_c1_g1_i2.p1 TRINITY_DN21_c1_g1~~TRINITY_DN21_c1_g1_i2.p1  ORF type:complete len:787 (+),score=209.93 TRINITY_DN21_c1_g1_i2:330-2363(+)
MEARHKKDRKEAAETISRLESLLREATDKTSEMVKTVRELRATVETKEKEIQLCIKKNTRLQALAEDLKQTNKNAEHYAKQLEKNLLVENRDGHTVDILQLSRQNHELMEEISHLRQENAKLKQTAKTDGPLSRAASATRQKREHLSLLKRRQEQQILTPSAKINDCQALMDERSVLLDYAQESLEQVDNLQAEIKRLCAELEEHKTEKSQLEEQLSQLEQRSKLMLAEAQDNASLLQQDNQSYQEQLSKAKDELLLLRSQLTNSKEELRRVTSQTSQQNDSASQGMQNLQQKIEELASKLQTVQQQYQKQSEKMNKLKAVLGARQLELATEPAGGAPASANLTDSDGLIASVHTLTTKLHQVQNELAVAKETVNTIREENKALRTALDTTTADTTSHNVLQKLTAENESLNQQIDQLQDEYTAAVRDMQTHLGECQGRGTALAEITAKYKKYKAMARSLQTNRAQVDSAISSQQREMGDLQRECIQLRAAIEVLRSENDFLTRKTNAVEGPTPRESVHSSLSCRTPGSSRPGTASRPPSSHHHRRKSPPPVPQEPPPQEPPPPPPQSESEASAPPSARQPRHSHHPPRSARGRRPKSAVVAPKAAATLPAPAEYYDDAAVDTPPLSARSTKSAAPQQRQAKDVRVMELLGSLQQLRQALHQQQSQTAQQQQTSHKR